MPLEFCPQENWNPAGAIRPPDIMSRPPLDQYETFFLRDISTQLLHAKVCPTDVRRFTNCFHFSHLLHSGHVRETGEPAFWHSARGVQFAMKMGCLDIDILCAIVLHDVVEDAPEFWDAVAGPGDRPSITRGFLKQLTQSSRSTAMVLDVSKARKGVYSKEERLARSVAQLSEAPEDTLIVKMVDRLDNLATMPWSREKRLDYIRETETCYMPLFQKAAENTKNPNNQIIRQLLSVFEQQLAALNKELNPACPADNAR